MGHPHNIPPCQKYLIFSPFFFHHRFLQCIILPTACFILSVIFLEAILWIGFQTVLCTYFSEKILLGRLTQTLISKNNPKAADRTMSSHVALELRSQGKGIRDLKELEAQCRPGQGQEFNLTILSVQHLQRTLQPTFTSGIFTALPRYELFLFYRLGSQVLEYLIQDPRAQSSLITNWRPSNTLHCSGLCPMETHISTVL